MDLEEKLAHIARELKRLDKNIVKDILELNSEDLFNHIENFIEKRKELRKTMLHYSCYSIKDKAAQDIIDKVINDVKFEADKFFELLRQSTNRADTEDVVKSLTELEQYELTELSDEHLYSWFGPSTYILDLYKIGSLILGISVPTLLEKYVSEARQSYAFQNYLAVYSMSRTILETAIRDVGQRKRKLPRDEGNVPRWELRNFNHMKNKVVPKHLKDEVQHIYDHTSGLIHGRKTVKSKEAGDMLRRTLKIVQRLYADYNLS